jgi:uroporphyrinogen III methyltransferase/synthase
MKILITRPRNQADTFAENLAQAGFDPVFFPVIEIRPIEENVVLDRALEKLACYDWVVFTSVNGVQVVFDRLVHPVDMGKGAGKGAVRVAAIGPKTARALELRAVRPDFVPEEFVAEAILPGMGDLRGRWVLLPRAEIARPALPQAIAAAGGVPHEVAVYRTVQAEPDPESLNTLKTGVAVVTFTSPSTVENFLQIVQQAGLDPFDLPGAPRMACIGPITQKAAETAGFRNLIVADEYTTDGLVKAIGTLD